MRVSGKEDDPGYENWLRIFTKNPDAKIIVLLNGAEVRYSVMADEEEGTVVFNPVDENGVLLPPDRETEEWIEKVQHGRVDILVRIPTTVEYKASEWLNRP